MLTRILENLIRIEGVNPINQSIYAYAEGSELQLQLREGGGLEIVDEKSTNSSVIYSRITNTGHLLRVIQGSNDLEVYDLSSNKLIKQFRGYQEEPYGKSRKPQNLDIPCKPKLSNSKKTYKYSPLPHKSLLITQIGLIIPQKSQKSKI